MCSSPPGGPPNSCRTPTSSPHFGATAPHHSPLRPHIASAFRSTTGSGGNFHHHHQSPPPPQLLPMHPTMCRAQETRWVVWRASTTNPRGLWIAADFVFFLPSEEKLGSAKWSSYSLALLITSTTDMPRCCAAKVDHQRLGWYAQTPVSWCHFTHTHLQGCGRKHFFAEEVTTIPKRGGANHFCFF